MTIEKNIGKKEIVDYLEKITKSVGLKDQISGKILDEIKNDFYESARNQNCILRIKNFFKINLRLFVKYIQGENNFIDNSFSNFQSSYNYIIPEIGDMFDYYFNEAKEPACIIGMPQLLPMPDTEAYKNFKLRLRIKCFLRQEKFESFATVMAHEMSHIVLHTIRHELKGSEIATDLCAMTQGFYEIFRFGRKTFRGQYGYLDDKQFHLAYLWIVSRKSHGLKKIWNNFLFLLYYYIQKD